jgi:predicted PurR-regulated permease PerM
MSRIDASPLIRGVASIPGALFGGLFTVFTGFVLAAFWLGTTEVADRELVSRLPSDRQLLVRTVSRDLSAVWGGWLRGELVLMVFVGSLAFIGLLALRVPYPVALAFWAGVTEIFPIVGPWVGGVPAVLLATLENPPLGLAVLLLYLGIQQVENNVLVPKVMQHAVGLQPFVVLVALLAGGTLLGIAGLVIAVPLAAAIQVVIWRVWVSPPVAVSDPGPSPSAAEERDPPATESER